jgi:putative DNA primase/helicase
MTEQVTAMPTSAISRTYVHEDRKLGKAKTLGRPAGIVRLTPDDDVLAGLCLAEGLETALSGMSIGLRPMWSTGSSGLLAAFPALPGVEVLTVVVDHDPSGAGEKAAREVEARWLAAAREVNLLRSEALGDLNDALKAAS